MNKKTATETMMEEAEKQRTEFIYSIIERIEKIEQCLNLTGTAGECTCNIKSKELAGICNYCYPRSNWNPDLPLHVRVAKALGKKVTKIGNIWYVETPTEGMYVGSASYAIPDYPNDLVAAMGALEEYCRETKNFSICYYPDFSKTRRISIWGMGTGGLSEINTSNPLPQAICETIVAHAEGKC